MGQRGGGGGGGGVVQHLTISHYLAGMLNSGTPYSLTVR